MRAIEERRLTLFYAIDPYDPGDRGRLAAPPEGYERSGLLNPALSAAIVAEARFIAGAYQPAYLAFGVEVNATFDSLAPASTSPTSVVYREVYDAVKEVSPQTLVFPTFQYEQLLGVTPWEVAHAPRWEPAGGLRRTPGPDGDRDDPVAHPARRTHDSAGLLPAAPTAHRSADCLRGHGLLVCAGPRRHQLLDAPGAASLPAAAVRRRGGDAVAVRDLVRQP